MFVVRELIECPFRDRSVEDQTDLVNQGCPPCDIGELWEDVDDEHGLAVARVAIAGRAEWVISCPVTQRLFCWSCLLFGEEDSEWSRHGCSDFRSLPERLKEHEVSVEHLKSSLEMKLFRFRNRSATPEKAAVGVPCLQDAGREEFGLLVDVLVSSVAFRNRPSYMVKDYDGRADARELRVLLESLRAFSPRPQSFSWAARFLEESPDAVPDLVDAVADVVRSAVRREMARAKHVSVVLSEHSRRPERSLISTVFSYALDGRVTERFVGFTSVPRQRSARDVLALLEGALDEFGARGRLLAYALDGGAVPAPQLREFTDLAPRGAYFVPWHGHSLEGVALQFLRDIREVDAFARHVAALRLFLDASPRRRAALDERLGAAEAPRFRKAHLSAAACARRGELLWLLSGAEDAAGLLRGLDDARHLFLHHLFSLLADAFRRVTDLLDEGPFERLLAPRASMLVQGALQSLGAKRLGLLTVAAKARAAKVCWDLDVPRMGGVFGLVMSLVRSQMQHRLAGLRRLHFAELVSGAGLPPDLESKFVRDIEQACPGVCPEAVRAEARLLAEARSKERRRRSSEESGPPPVLDTLEGSYRFLRETGLDAHLPNVTTVMELCLSLPVRKPAGESAPKQDLLRDWGEYADAVVLPGDQAVLLVERDLLQELAKGSGFCDEVRDAFVKRREASARRGDSSRSDDSSRSHDSSRSDDSSGSDASSMQEASSSSSEDSCDLEILPDQ